MKLRTADDVSTAPLVAFGLVGGFVTARESGTRPLGGVVLGLAGLYAGRTWASKGSPVTTAALSALYIGGFGGSHPLAKKIGVWPSVLGVAVVNAAASYAFVDRR